MTISLFAILICFSCQGQKNQKDKARVMPALLDNSKVLEQIESNMLNQLSDDKKEGLWRTYYQNDQLKSEGMYSAGLKEGLHREWGSDGVLYVEGSYEKGKANGLMKWFHEKGHLAGAGNMIDDVRVGEWKICDIEENGFCIEAFFKDGKRDGVWKIYHDSGIDLLWKEQTWKNDKVVSEKCWDEMGEKIECQ